MIFLFIFIAIIVIYIVYYLINNKYINFIINHSVSLKQLLEINKKYNFCKTDNLDQSYIYDNEIFYDSISCLDYLIYQLQFITKKFYKQLDVISYNQNQYPKYINAVKQIQPGQFSAPIGKLNLNKLIKKEKIILMDQFFKKPDTIFSINVILYCSTIKGRIYSKKQETFSSDTISTLTKRLGNKRGTFYNDKDIWDSLCRVERGKVSNKIRFSIYERDGYRCRICGATNYHSDLEIDHIIPIAKGGKSNYDNLQTLCHKCNYNKGSKL